MLPWLAAAFALLSALALVECLVLFRPLRRPAKRSRTTGTTRFSKDRLPPRVDAVIIGSGPGGLSCGAALSQFGERVVVCEQHQVIGGGSHTFAVEGKTKYRFDSGLHFTIPLHEHLLHVACGTDAAPVRVSKMGEDDGTYERIVLADTTAAPPLEVRDDVQLADELRRRYPQHADNITAYFSRAESVQIRFALWCAGALLPLSLRLLLLRSPLMRPWRRWAAVTAAEGLAHAFPGDDAETHKLRAFAAGLWLDSGASPSPPSLPPPPPAQQQNTTATTTTTTSLPQAHHHPRPRVTPSGSPPSRMSFWMQTAVFGGFQKMGAAYPHGGPQVPSPPQRGRYAFPLPRRQHDLQISRNLA